ncbi:MAG: A/G-specific adenine glycosylase [Gammaproteobacteria bacterium]|nr:A/G-specific adenine glycosylase [Gammaproteobacteria bacterium]
MPSKTYLANKLIRWYRIHGRHDLPWQRNKTAYRVWISEIMLQQTQVTTVIPYYLKFMRRFPNLKSLANASQDDVLAHWSGLGYYARARNMHKAAQIIQQQHSGRFPTQIEDIVALPGIGRSTAGAVLSFSKELPATILDGNVKRVLCRVFAIDGWPGKTDTLKQLWELAEQLTPQKNTAEYNQAIMDLGATICTRNKPNCPACPIKSDCQSFQQGTQNQYPHSKPKKAYPTKEVSMVIIQDSRGHIFLQKRPPTGIWGGLWCLPEFTADKNIADVCLNSYQFKINVVSHETTLIKHKFSHFQLDINVIYADLYGPVENRVMETDEQVWYKVGSPLPGGIAAPTSKILQSMKG